MSNLRRLLLALFASLLFTQCLAFAGSIYDQTNLSSDIPGLAATTDANLHNPWGMSFSGTSPFWVSDQGAHVATLYTGTGAPQALVVSIPPASGVPSGPTGQVFAGGQPGFLVGGSGANFIFATLAGTIDAWNNTQGTTAAVEHTTPGAVYTGLALASDTLFAANFSAKRIDVFDSTFSPVSQAAGAFTDPTIPAAFAPYNIQAINGLLYVEYAEPAPGGAVQGAGLGFVRVYRPDGSLASGAPSISGGTLNAPWGVTVAPSNFGDFTNDLLVGNFGDGDINAFDPVTGAFLGALMGASGPVTNSGLWALATRTGGAGVNTSAVYFTAGINSEADGLFGAITVVSPEPGTIVFAAAGLLTLAMRRRRPRGSAR